MCIVSSFYYLFFCVSLVLLALLTHKHTHKLCTLLHIFFLSAHLFMRLPLLLLLLLSLSSSSPRKNKKMQKTLKKTRFLRLSFLVLRFVVKHSPLLRRCPLLLCLHFVMSFFAYRAVSRFIRLHLHLYDALKNFLAHISTLLLLSNNRCTLIHTQVLERAPTQSQLRGFKIMRPNIIQFVFVFYFFYFDFDAHGRSSSSACWMRHFSILFVAFITHRLCGRQRGI